MSGFGGQMKEYRQISIDRFDKGNLKATAYFLSHCHRDHMVGLDQLSFLRSLKSRNNIFLYCSEVTKLLLLSENVFKSLAPYIRVLEIGVATTVTLHEAGTAEYKGVTVTALPAGHCPGSVMFLFEGKEGRALYTGDFRWEKNYATTLPALCVNGHLKEIDSMYVDTTFCVPEAFYIPSRDDCLSATASFVVAWLRQAPHRYVHVSSRSKYGHEPLLSHLAQEAKTQIHTSRQKAEMYEQIKELKGIFTADPGARIHACSWQADRQSDSHFPCGYIPPKRKHAETDESPEVMVVRPSTMWFTAEPSRLQELVVSPASGRGLHRVCYSFHSSYSELRDLVSLLKPRRVYPNVLPASDSEWRQVKERLERFLTYQHKHHISPAGETVTAKPLGLLKRKRTESFQKLTDSEGLIFDSPEKPRQPKQGRYEDDEVHVSSQKSCASIKSSPAKSEAHSSYRGSDSEEDMFADSDEVQTTPVKQQQENDFARESTETKGSQSLRSYVSGDEEVPDEDQASSPQFRHVTSRDDTEGDFAPDFDLDDCDVKESKTANESSIVCCKMKKEEGEAEGERVGTSDLQSAAAEPAVTKKADRSGLKESEKSKSDGGKDGPDKTIKSVVENPVTEFSNVDLSLKKNAKEVDSESKSVTGKNASEKCVAENPVGDDLPVLDSNRTNSRDDDETGKVKPQVEKSDDGTADIETSVQMNVKEDSESKCRNGMDGADKNVPRNGKVSKLNRPGVDGNQVQSEVKKTFAETSIKTTDKATTRKRTSCSEGTADSNQETNLISSDSDSDADCKITKSFIRRQQGDPQLIQHHKAAMSLPRCPVHCKCSSMQKNPGQNRILIGSGTLYKTKGFPSAKTERNSEVSEVDLPEEGPQPASGHVTEKASETVRDNKDVVSSEKRDSDAQHTRDEKEASKVSDDGDQIVTVEQASLKNFHAADEADVEDNDEDETDNEKSKQLHCSRNKNILSRLDTDSQRSSPDVIVIEDCESGLSSRDILKEQTGDGVQGSRGYSASACQHTSSRQDKHCCQVHMIRSPVPMSIPSGSNQGKSYCQSYICSPTKSSHDGTKGQISSSQTRKPYPKHGFCHHSQQQGFSPVKETRCSHHAPQLSISPVKPTGSSQSNRSPEKQNLSQSHGKTKGASGRQAEKRDSSSDSPTKRSPRKDKSSSEKSGEPNQSPDQEDEQSAECKELGREDDDSDATLPPDSPVAVHRSDSDSDADCKITQSFISSPQRSGRQPQCVHHSHLGHGPKLGRGFGLNQSAHCCRHSHDSRFQHRHPFRPQSQGEVLPQTVTGATRPVSSTVTSYGDRSKQNSSVIDLTEEDD